MSQPKYVQLNFRTAEEGQNGETLMPLCPDEKATGEFKIRVREWKDIERSRGADYESVHNRIDIIGTDGGRAFTITFTDKLLRTFRPEYLYTIATTEVKKTRGVIDYEFVGEYSDTGRYHLHGVISTNDVKVLATLNRKLRKFGILKIKMVNNTTGWADYCTKQLIPKKDYYVNQSDVKRISKEDQ